MCVNGHEIEQPVWRLGEGAEKVHRDEGDEHSFDRCRQPLGPTLLTR